MFDVLANYVECVEFCVRCSRVQKYRITKYMLINTKIICYTHRKWGFNVMSSDSEWERHLYCRNVYFCSECTCPNAFANLHTSFIAPGTFLCYRSKQVVDRTN